jgi:UDP-N-acetylmuramyl tripeptide synthase
MAAKSWAPVESFALERTSWGGRRRAGRARPGQAAEWARRPHWYHGRDRTGGIAYGTLFNLYHDGQCLGDFETPLVGDFNVQNCLAAIAAARSVGAGWDGIREG